MNTVMGLNIEKKRLDFWYFFLQEIKLDIIKKFQEGPEPFKNIPNYVFENILKMLILDLEPIILPAIVCSLKEYSTPNNEGKVYHELFSDSPEQTLQKLEKKYSGTFNSIYNRCRRFLSHLQISCNRIFKDWDMLKYNFDLEDMSKITTIQLNCGDEHQYGTQTSIFYFDDQKKGFVYKPIPIATDKTLHDIFGWLDSNYSNDYRPQLKVMERKDSLGDYGYIEICEYQGNIDTVDKAKTIYESYGQLLAIGKFFKIADGHSDNIIINGQKAIWLDLETAFHFYYDKIEDVNNLEETGLLMEAKPENTVLGIVTGIQGGVIPRLGITSPSPNNDGTDEMYLRYFQLFHPTHMKNRIFLNGSLCKPEDFIEEIKEGFRKGYINLIENKEKIITFIKHRFNNDFLIGRVLFQATASYARYISLLNHVICQRQGDTLSLIREERNLTLSASERPFARFIIEHEIIDLTNGVIPYFYRTNRSRALHHTSGFYKENYFKKSLLEECLDHINNLTLGTLDTDLAFIERALLSTANIDSWDKFRERFNFKQYEYDNRITEENLSSYN